MKNALYVAVTARTYRQAIDDYFESPEKYEAALPRYLSEIGKCTTRDFCTGFYFGAPKDDSHIYYDGIYIRDWDVIANVLSSDGEFVTVTQRNRFFRGDELEVMTPGEEPFPLTVTEMFNEAMEPIDVAPNPMATIRIRCDRDIPQGSVLRIRNRSQKGEPNG